MNAKIIEETIIRFSEGATDNRADGVMYKLLAIELEKKFEDEAKPHIHEAGKNGDIDECNLCGHDIRHKIHN